MGWAHRVLVATIAALLLTGVGAAATIDPPRPSVNTRVGAAGLGQEGLADAETPTPPAPPAVVVTTISPAPPTPVLAPAATVPARTAAPTTTEPAPSPAPAPAITLAPGITLPPLPPLLPILPVVDLAPVGSWSNTSNGVSVRMRMDPVTPLAGQPVRFTIDVSAQDPCCVVILSYGDGTARPGFGGGCDSPHSRTGLIATHTFASPGDYQLQLVVTTFPCVTQPRAPGEPVVAPPINGAGILACIGVGIRLPVRPSCAPFEHFRPETVYTYA